MYRGRNPRNQTPATRMLGSLIVGGLLLVMSITNPVVADDPDAWIPSGRIVMPNEEPVVSPHFCIVGAFCGTSQADFGSSLGISENTMVVGHPNAQTVHIYQQMDNFWLEETTFTGSEGFGSAVAIEGDVIAVGAPDASELQIWARDGGEWVSSATFSREGCLATSLALSEGRLVAGNKCESSIHVFEPTDDGWFESAVLSVEGATSLGRVVAFNDDRIVSGTSLGLQTFKLDEGDWTSALVSPLSVRAMGVSGDTIAAESRDRVRIYEQVGSEWIQTAQLFPEDTSPFDVSESLGKGGTLAMEGNTLAIGVLEDDSSPGVVPIDQDTPGPCISEFGAKVCLPPQPGSVYIFERSDGEWIQETKITGDMAGDGRFGDAVALSRDGATLVVGEPFKAVSGFATILDIDPANSVHVFSRVEV